MKKAQERGEIPKDMNIFALAWSMKNKGDKPHYKPGVKDVKKAKYKNEDVEESKLPPHLSKFFDKKGDMKPDVAKRVAAGRKKREAAAKVTDVTPKGYGPSEDVEMDEGPFGRAIRLGL